MQDLTCIRLADLKQAVYAHFAVDATPALKQAMHQRDTAFTPQRLTGKTAWIEIINHFSISVPEDTPQLPSPGTKLKDLKAQVYAAYGVTSTPDLKAALTQRHAALEWDFRRWRFTTKAAWQAILTDYVPHLATPVSPEQPPRPLNSNGCCWRMCYRCLTQAPKRQTLILGVVAKAHR